MADADLPPMESCGFIRVPTPGDVTADPLWLTCDSCKKSDHFWVDGDTVRCRCGASYSHAARPDGRNVPTSELAFVPWKQGPMSLADAELDPMRLTLGIVLLLAVLGGGGFGVWWLLN